MPHGLSVTGTHWHFDIAAVPARTAMVLSGRQAATRLGQSLHGWPSTNATNSDRPTQAKMLRESSVNRCPTGGTGMAKANGMNGRLGRLALDRRVDWLEGCSSEESGTRLFPGWGTPPGPSTTVARRQPTEDGLFLPEATLLERGRGWCNVETREAEQRVRRSCHVSQANDMATAE